MKKSFKKLGFVSLATSSVLLGSMNATDLETYAALQKLSHVFGNYAEKDKDGKLTSDSPTQQQAQTQAQNTASSVAHQLHQPHQLKKMKQVAHQVLVGVLWQAS
ncbi:hypothetical protein HpKG66_00420 [Helicobacter pylori]